MKVFNRKVLAAAIIGTGLVSSATAGEVFVTADISTSTTWTAGNTYNLQNQIYVLPGATLTIEAGTRVASTPSSNGSGSLAVCKGAQIFAEGTASAPIVMTSSNDDGTWREACNEWGNLTIMGDAYISENATVGNSATPDANNYAIMEGLTEGFPGDTRVRYGGGNDDDDSGSISHLSIRYGGRVVGLANELNGLSLGGIGRGTDIDHIEIMNNVDDGIEIWGGTVCLSYVSIWNIGDDSFDIDQGWRGKAQYGLIVQGFSADASQGSGVGDNMCETDGAEDSDWQPVTSAAIYNFTLIGQPVDGDGATAWRDNARVQYRNCVIMDCGEKVVRPDGDDGDGASGYGHNGTLTWEQHWTTDASTLSGVNAPSNPAAFYTAQDPNGKLCEITDSVFFRNLNGSAYDEANARGVFGAGSNNVLIAGFDDTDSPILSCVRDAPVVRGGKTMLQVISLDPRPANEAITSVSSAPNDGFFTAANYRGGFEPNAPTWLAGWTASEEFGFTNTGDALEPGFAYCSGDGSVTACPCGNAGGVDEGCANDTGSGAALSATGSASLGVDDLVLTCTNLTPGPGLFFQGNNAVNSGNGNPFGDGLRCAGGSVRRLEVRFANNANNFTTATTISVGASGAVSAGQTKRYQYWYRDAGTSPCNSLFNLSNGYEITWGA